MFPYKDKKMSIVIEKLNSIGLYVGQYKRGPAGKHSFAIAVEGQYLKLWEGDAEITVHTDRRKRQAVITVEEKPRNITAYVQTYCEHNDDDTPERLLRNVKINCGIQFLRSVCAVSVPNSRLRIVEVKSLTGGSSPNRVRVKLLFTTKRTITSFLVGFDNDAVYPFVSQLKKIVNTVDEAHKELLPVGIKLKPGHLRQGEWFFNPVSKKTAVQLNRNIHKAKYKSVSGVDTWNMFTDRRDFASSHRGLTLSLNKKNYVIGVVRDARKGRHFPLFLNGWYEVIRNNEVVVSRKVKVWD